MSLANKINARVSAIEDGAKEILPELAEIFAGDLRDVLGKQGSPEDRSKPGEAPRRQTGELQESVQVFAYPNQGVAYIGPTAPHGKFLVKSRPFYDITVAKAERRMRDLLDEI